MKKRIFWQTMLASMAVLLVSLLLVGGILFGEFSDAQQSELMSELSLAKSGVEKFGLEYLSALEPSGCRLTWVAADGEVLYDSEASAASLENHSAREEIAEALATGRGSSARYSSTLTEKTVYEAERLSDGSVLRASQSRSTVWALILSMLAPALAVVAVAAALSAIIADRSAKRVVEPLNNLDLEHPLENSAYDELAPLLRRIDRQRAQIDEQLGELRRRTDEFNRITESMREGLVLLDSRGRILSINRAARELFGADEGAVGADFLVVERRSDVLSAIKDALASGHGEARVERDGREYQLDASRAGDDGGAGAVLLIQDISEKSAAERSRREFSANVSHELKTPLQSILGGAELIESGMAGERDARRFAGQIRREAARLQTLIDDIIRLSQLDEGVSPPSERVELGALCREVAEELSAAAAEKNVRVSVEGEGAISGARGLLYEAVYNLCDNAIKYNHEGGSVKISVEPSGKVTTLRVADSGIGIPKEHRDRVFERFYRVDKSHSRAGGGTGLGLAIVKHVAQYHGARLELESEEGAGTEISLVFSNFD